MNIFLVLFIIFTPIFLLFVRRRKPSNRIPPGSLGIPIIGQSLSLLWAMRANTADKWMQERAQKYGPVSKLSLFGKPTVFIHGPSANKFVFTNDSGRLSNHQTESITRILGDRSLLELRGEDHKRIRSALSSFLKPDCLKNYVAKIEQEVDRHLEMHWNGKEKVTVLPLMKSLTFNIICSILFGIERGARRDALVHLFEEQMKGMWSAPINLPFTRFNRSLKASAKIKHMLKELIREKRTELEKGASTHQDLITCLLSLQGDDGRELISEKEIIHNIMLIMTAGHDTSSVLITFIVRLLANDPKIHEDVLKEQEEITKVKKSGDPLTWEDLSNMKLTWRVAMENLRTIPPVFGGFRTTLEDTEYEGYLIPKGWQIFFVTTMTHMDPEIFPEPSKFDPDRFLNQATIPPYSYIPFGAGPRICPGYEFAKIETLVAIHCLVTRFTWKLCCKDDSFRRDPMPVPNEELPIQITPRKLV